MPTRRLPVWRRENLLLTALGLIRAKFNILFHGCLQAAGSLFLVFSYFNKPQSGKSLLVLLIITTLMLLVDMKPWQKAIYVVVIVCLTLAENRALDRDHAEFEAKMSDLTGSITGGDSYAYVEAYLGPAPPFRLSLYVEGKYGVHNAAAEIQTVFQGRDKESVGRQFALVRPLALGSHDFHPGFTPINETAGPGMYSIRILTTSSDIRETIT